MTEPTLPIPAAPVGAAPDQRPPVPLGASIDRSLAPAPPAPNADGEIIASYKKTFNLTVLTVARGWSDHLRGRPAKASWTGATLLVVALLGFNGWLDPATLQALISSP